MPADNPNGGARQLKPFAWQGIRLTVPADWELISTQGKHASGYVGLADKRGQRLQLKWDEATAKSDPSDSVNSYLAHLRKKAKKDKLDIKVNREVKLASLKGKKIECYEWTADQLGLGMVSQCEQCKRIVHLVVLGKPGENLRGLARTVFGSLRDHPEDGQMAWDFFDFAFSVPEKMRLHHCELKTGCIRMVLRQKGREMEFVRASLAQVVLADKSVKQWFHDFYGSEIKRRKVKMEQAEIKGHPGLRVNARPWLIANPGRLVRRGREMLIACWHCEPSNRLFIVRHDGRRGEQERFEQAVQSVRCCPDQ